MTRHACQAITSLVMVVTMALSLIVTLPIAQRYSQAKVQAVAASHKGGGLPSALLTSAIYPSLAAFIGSTLLGTLAGFMVGRKLPRAERGARRDRSKGAVGR